MLTLGQGNLDVDQELGNPDPVRESSDHLLPGGSGDKNPRRMFTILKHSVKSELIPDTTAFKPVNNSDEDKLLQVAEIVLDRKA